MWYLKRASRAAAGFGVVISLLTWTSAVGYADTATFSVSAFASSLAPGCFQGLDLYDFYYGPNGPTVPWQEPYLPSPQVFTGGNGYSVSVSAWDGAYPTSDEDYLYLNCYSWDPNVPYWNLETAQAGYVMRLDVTGPPVTMFGGDFYSGDCYGNLVPDVPVKYTLSDGLQVTTDQPFVGFQTDNPISWVQITIPGENLSNPTWVTTAGGVVFGQRVPAVPESPSGLLLVAGAVPLGLLVLRMRR